MTSSPRSLDLAFARQARATPDAPALVEAGRVTSYAELEGAAGHIAGLLQARDVGDGAIVGLHLERGHSWVAATLGALSTGAAVLPLPPSYPLERRRAIVAGAEPAIVLADEATPVPAELDAPVLDLSPGAGAVGALPERVEDGPPGASPAFVMSSSGTTGRPKLIVRSHRSFFHRLEWTWRTLPFRDGEVGCQKAHQTTTHAVYELFEPLLRGIPSLIVPDATVRDLEAFWSEVRSAGVTRLLLVPSMLRATLEEAAFTPPPIRALILMGEAVPPGLARSAVEAFPPSTPLYSIYGSTEASSLLAVDLRRAAREESGLPLGEPLSADITTQVLGTDGRPVARGETGRLHIRGPALFDEYLGDEELTASVVRRVDGERWFDTRDDVRIHPDGSLRFVGRTDHTVKIRGFRVDLDEVERHLRGLPGVSDAVAVAAPAPAGGGALVLHTYVTPSDPDPEELLRQLRDVLPEHAVPSLLRAVDEFPRTSSGKVDRRRLAQEGLSGEQRWSDAGRSDEERALAGIWGRILGHGEFSHDTSFFEAGGSSLSAFALLREVRDRFALDPAELDVTHILANPTIEALARRLSREREGHVPEDHASPGLVVLKTGRSPLAPPLVLLSAAGGTLGAYQRLVR
ncbi:MAG: non-ribosomal peptide synthetase, partial [Gemmatimonadota bacterium]